MFRVLGISRIDPQVLVPEIKKEARLHKIPARVFNPSKKLTGIVFVFDVKTMAEVLLKSARLKRRITPILFEAAPALSDRPNVKILDANSFSPSKVAKLVMVHLNTKYPKTIPVVKSDRVIRALLEASKKKHNFLSKYQTIFYSIKKDMQPVVKRMAVNFLVGKWTESTFDREMTKVTPKRGEGVNKYTAFANVVKSDTGRIVRTAIARALKGEDVIRLANELQIPAFDVRYFIKAAEIKNKEDTLLTGGKASRAK